MDSNQVKEMLEMMREQMNTVKALQEENKTLKQENMQLEVGKKDVKTKRPDCPLISDSDWLLFLDSWSRYRKDVGPIRS